MTSAERRSHLDAALRARHDLGPEYDRALVESFVDGIDDEIDRRIAARVGGGSKGGSNPGLVMGIVSLGTGIPISAISASLAHLPGLMTAWAGIAAVNAAVAWGQQRR